MATLGLGKEGIKQAIRAEDPLLSLSLVEGGRWTN